MVPSAFRLHKADVDTMCKVVTVTLSHIYKGTLPFSSVVYFIPLYYVLVLVLRT